MLLLVVMTVFSLPTIILIANHDPPPSVMRNVSLHRSPFTTQRPGKLLLSFVLHFFRVLAPQASPVLGNDTGIDIRIRRWHLSAYLNTTANIITFQFYNLFKSISWQCISLSVPYLDGVLIEQRTRGEKAESWNSSPLWQGTQLPKINEWDRFLEAEIGS